MIRPTVTAETDLLLSIAEGTGVFKPIEIETLRELLDDFHAGANATPAGHDPSGHRAVTLERDGQPVGFAYYAPTVMTDRTWHLYWIFVGKAGQGGGLGSELLKFVENDIVLSGGRLFLIETSSLPSYEPTRRFYLKHGYEQAATVRDFYSDCDDQVIFRKHLLS
jgi:GNAT superfamily N-acetyltransferase